jgi:L-amino acid N-acyltransferase YncA
MRIRDAEEADLPAIVEIYNQNVPTRVSVADTEPISVKDREAWFHEHDPDRRPIRIAEDDDGGVGGWLSLSDFYDGRPAYHATVEIGVYVRGDLQGQGIARRLLQEATSRAPERGIKTLTAGIFGHNRPSIGLFEGFGFREWARFPGVAELDGVERDLVILGLRVDSVEER